MRAGPSVLRFDQRETAPLLQLFHNPLSSQLHSRPLLLKRLPKRQIHKRML